MARGSLLSLMTTLIPSLYLAFSPPSSPSLSSPSTIFTFLSPPHHATHHISTPINVATRAQSSSSSSSSSDEDPGVKCAADVLALLGGKQAAATLNATRAHQLLASMRFLAPLQSSSLPPAHRTIWPVKLNAVPTTGGGSLGSHGWRDMMDRKEMQRRVLFPPPSVAELAKAAVEWAGEPGAILSKLGSTLYPVPDVEGTGIDQCQLAKNTSAQRFALEEINRYMAFLFEAIHVLGPSVGFNVSLSRYDLFHGHMFTAFKTGRLGILFHTREYPEFDKVNFPINLGFCQRGSNVPYDASMDLRNILWLAPMPQCLGHQCSKEWLAPGVLVILDAHPGGVFYKELVPEWVDVVRTIYEGDFGNVFIDVNYLNVANAAPEARIFMC